MIYLDNAATTLKKISEVEAAMIQALRNAGNAGRGTHLPSLHASRILYDTRKKLADLFGVSDPSRIAFACNATEALNMAICGAIRPGDHVITSVCEHNSVLRPLYRLQAQGAELSFLETDDRGILRYDMLEGMLRKNTSAVVLTHASNLTGNVTDLARITSVTKRHGILLIVDAAQSAGVLPIQAERSGIDVLCFTGHKGLMGPQGTGGLYVREGLELEPWKVGGSGIHSYDRNHPVEMPERLEAGTRNLPGIAGLGAAIDGLMRIGVGAVQEKERMLARRFVEEIRDVPGIQIYGDPDAMVGTGIVSLNIGEQDSGMVSDRLWEEYEICVRAGAHCAPLMHQALGTKKQGAARFSFSYYNTVEEAVLAARAVRELAAKEQENGSDCSDRIRCCWERSEQK